MKNSVMNSSSSKIERIILLTIISMFAVFLAGCGGAAERGISMETPFIGGTNGLISSFISGAPPDAVTDHNQFPFGIAVQLENVGESDIAFGDGYVEIRGINPVDFGLPTQAYLRSPLLKEGKLSGARKNFDGTIIPGTITVAEFPFDPSGEIDMLTYTQDLHGNTNVIIRANACYNYKTKTSTKICVKENILEVEEKPPLCIVNEPKNPQNSGAPVHIISLSEAPVGAEKIQVTFTMAHIGNPSDSFFAPGTDCDDTITNPYRYVVFVNVTSDINGVYADCSGLEDPEEGPELGPNNEKKAGFVRLFRAEPRTVTCTFDLTGVEGEFEELFEVELGYRYMQSIEKPLLIRDVSVPE